MLQKAEVKFFFLFSTNKSCVELSIMSLCPMTDLTLFFALCSGRSCDAAFTRCWDSLPSWASDSSAEQRFVYILSEVKARKMNDKHWRLQLCRWRIQHSVEAHPVIYSGLSFSIIQDLSWGLVCKQLYLVWLWSTFEHCDVIGLPLTTSEDSTSHRHLSVVTWEQPGLLQCWVLVESGRRLTAVRGRVLGGRAGFRVRTKADGMESWGWGRGCTQ